MINDETKLLHAALRYEDGHPRRTQHILKVYALAKMLGEIENFSREEQLVLNAASILHDIPIKYCKEHHGGDASQENQKKEAPRMVAEFLTEANYSNQYFAQILELVEKHHDYGCEKSRMLQVLMEADLVINFYESKPTKERLQEMENVFKTKAGKELLNLCIKGMGI